MPLVPMTPQRCPMTPDSPLAARVQREKTANESADIIQRSMDLKRRFRHLLFSPAMARMHADGWQALQCTPDMRVLDFGCGKGDTAARLLAMGAAVEGIDISQSYIDAATAQARQKGYDPARYRFQVMDAHALQFPDNSFDLVVGNAILHHLDFLKALKEVHRVLRPGGRAVFQEPLGGNPLLKILRRLTPGARTPDERPFFERDLIEIEKMWQVQSKYYGLVTTPVAALTSFLLRPWPGNIFVKMADRLDIRLRQTKAFRSWHQYVLFDLVKPLHQDVGRRPESAGRVS